MPLKLYCSLVLLFCFNILSAQLITVRGVVKNTLSGEFLPGATISTGVYGTTSNNNGEFVFQVSSDAIKQHGLSISLFGYKKLDIAYNGLTYQVKLQPMPIQLSEVSISSNSGNLVKKAYNQISKNYLDSSAYLIGSLKLTHSATKNGFEEYHYKNDSFIKLYLYPYKQKRQADVSLINKSDTVKQWYRSFFNVPFVGGYTRTSKSDLVNARADFLKGDRKRFAYKFIGKDFVNGNRVFVMSFVSKNNDSGMLYIDTATLGFVRVKISEHNVQRKDYATLDKSLIVCDYKKVNNKWVLSAVEISAYATQIGYSIKYTTEFKIIGLDTHNAQPFSKTEAIIQDIEDKNVKCPIIESTTSNTVAN